MRVLQLKKTISKHLQAIFDALMKFKSDKRSSMLIVVTNPKNMVIQDPKKGYETEQSIGCFGDPEMVAKAITQKASEDPQFHEWMAQCNAHIAIGLATNIPTNKKSTKVIN